MPYFATLTPTALKEWSQSNFDSDNVLKPYITEDDN